MAQEKTFRIAIMDYSDCSVRIFSRVLPADIQTEELEEMLEKEGIYDHSECYIMFGDEIRLEVD